MSLSTIIADELRACLKPNKDIITSTRPLQTVESANVFSGKNIPTISLDNYIERLKLYINCENVTFSVALIYLQRVQRKNENFLLTPYNVHRLFLSCVIVADKYLNDEFLKNSDYAQIGGVSNEELNALEHQLLKLLDFDLFVRETVNSPATQDITDFF
eukprot:TRINITY_DN9569_c0_g5_i1.p1 TRINITY_DN9569_c0_g5~~TRINITY_DN9569_c0_g5_i1.p1  ORF type:complete len:159 (-),score=38.52 TRINITY_DN9569_c0_g5_i1:159-635(-)